MNNIFSPSSELNNLKLDRPRHHHRWLSQSVTVTRHDGRHKDAALKVTESDSPPDTLNHHKVIQGQSGGPESGHHRGLSVPRNTLNNAHIMMDNSYQCNSVWCLSTCWFTPGVAWWPRPRMSGVWASLQSDLVTSPSLSALWSRPTDTITQALTPSFSSQ